jgi:hypothetical protein
MGSWKKRVGVREGWNWKSLPMQHVGRFIVRVAEFTLIIFLITGSLYTKDRGGKIFLWSLAGFVLGVLVIDLWGARVRYLGLFSHISDEQWVKIDRTAKLSFQLLGCVFMLIATIFVDYPIVFKLIFYVISVLGGFAIIGLIRKLWRV